MSAVLSVVHSVPSLPVIGAVGESVSRPNTSSASAGVSASNAGWLAESTAAQPQMPRVIATVEPFKRDEGFYVHPSAEYVEICEGKEKTARVLVNIVFRCQLDENGEARLKTFKRNAYWWVRDRVSMAAECRLTLDQLRTALKHLKRLNLVEALPLRYRGPIQKYVGETVMHYRLTVAHGAAALSAWPSKAELMRMILDGEKSPPIGGEKSPPKYMKEVSKGELGKEVKAIKPVAHSASPSSAPSAEFSATAKPVRKEEKQGSNKPTPDGVKESSAHGEHSSGSKIPGKATKTPAKRSGKVGVYLPIVDMWETLYREHYPSSYVPLTQPQRTSLKKLHGLVFDGGHGSAENFVLWIVPAWRNFRDAVIASKWPEFNFPERPDLKALHAFLPLALELWNIARERYQQSTQTSLDSSLMADWENRLDTREYCSISDSDAALAYLQKNGSKMDNRLWSCFLDGLDCECTWQYVIDTVQDDEPAIIAECEYVLAETEKAIAAAFEAQWFDSNELAALVAA